MYMSYFRIHGNNFNIFSRIFYILTRITLWIWIKIQQVRKKSLVGVLKFDPNFISSKILSISNIYTRLKWVQKTLYIA